MLRLQCNNGEEKRIDKKIFEKILHLVSKQEKFSNDREISLAIVNDEEIRRLNKLYRGKDKPTDVLSFSFENKGWSETEEKNILGEVIISFETVKKNAKENKTTIDKELAKVFCHGVYHLFGYDHEKEEEAIKMEKKEELILKKFNVQNKKIC